MVGMGVGVTIRVGSCRKEGTADYGSIGASCEVEVTLPGAPSPAEMLAARDFWQSFCGEAVDADIGRQRAALSGAAPAPRPAAAPAANGKPRVDWPSADHGEAARRSPDRGGRNQDGPPRSGGGLYARLKDLDEHNPDLGVVNHIKRWAKSQGNDAPMKEWDDAWIRAGWERAQKYMRSLDDSDRLQRA